MKYSLRLPRGLFLHLAKGHPYDHVLVTVGMSKGVMVRGLWRTDSTTSVRFHLMRYEKDRAVAKGVAFWAANAKKQQPELRVEFVRIEDVIYAEVQNPREQELKKAFIEAVIGEYPRARSHKGTLLITAKTLAYGTRHDARLRYIETEWANHLSDQSSGRRTTQVRIRYRCCVCRQSLSADRHGSNNDDR